MKAVHTMPWLASEPAAPVAPDRSQQLASLAHQLRQLSLDEQQQLLQPWLQQAQQQWQQELQQQWAAQWRAEQEQQQHDLQQRLHKAAQAQQQQWLHDQQQQWRQLVAQLQAPAVVAEPTDTDLMLALALELTEKIVRHQLSSPELYRQWLEVMLQTRVAKGVLRLVVSAADHQLLQQWQLLPELEARFGAVQIGAVDRFSFELHTDQGSVGHHSADALKQLQQWVHDAAR